MNETPKPSKPHRSRAAETASLVRRGVALKPLKTDATWLVELLEHEYERVFNEGLLLGGNTIMYDASGKIVEMRQVPSATPSGRPRSGEAVQLAKFVVRSPNAFTPSGEPVYGPAMTERLEQLKEAFAAVPTADLVTGADPAIPGSDETVIVDRDVKPDNTAK